MVNYAYNNQMALNRIFSQRDTYLSQDNSYYYLQATQYDAAGRVTWRSLGANDLGSNPLLENTYEYYDWGQEGGRLHVLQSGTYTNTTSLQNLVYNYDNVGNVDTIQDYTTGNPQTQSFGYDTLNRLVSASATNGASGHGNYSETYTYDAATGNLASKTGIGSYAYSGEHPHAVTSTGNGWTYEYDANGNMTLRNLNGSVYNLSYDAENRLVSASGAGNAMYGYDGDGNRVTSVISGTTTVYIGNYYEWTSTSTKRYYGVYPERQRRNGEARLAMRDGNDLYYLFGDHLGSTSKSYRVSTGATTTLLYKAWGTSRYSSGSLPTTYRFTGQREESSLGLYYYGARWYDPALGRWIQPDSIIPLESQGVQAWDRYSYVNSNPLKYSDPKGHRIEGEWGFWQTPPPPYKPTSTSRPKLEDILKSIIQDVESQPKICQPPTSTPTTTPTERPSFNPAPTLTPTQEPFTWKDAEDAFDEVVDPELADWERTLPQVFVLYLPDGPIVIDPRAIAEQVSAVLTTIFFAKEKIKSVIQNSPNTDSIPKRDYITPIPLPIHVP